MPARNALPISSTSLATPVTMRVADGIQPDAEAGADDRADIGETVGRLAGQQHRGVPARPSISLRSSAFTASHCGGASAGPMNRQALQPAVREMQPRDRCRASPSTIFGEFGRPARTAFAHARARSRARRRSQAGRRCRPRRATRAHQPSCGSAIGMSAQREAAKREVHRHDRGGRRLGLGLAGERIGRGHDQIADARRRGVGVAPVDRREQRAAPLPVADHDPQHAAADARRHAREVAVASGRARTRRPDAPRRTAPADAPQAAGSGRCASWCATGRARGRC